jgi:cell division protein ZapD
MIVYEYPLNERTRTLLRLEDLFEKVKYFSAKSAPVEHHCALISMFEILDVGSRSELKLEVLQELDRQKHALEALRQNPAISEQALADVLREIEQVSTLLLELPGKTGQHLRDNDWLMSIKQRTSIPGGVCEFDLPSYHYWLHKDASERRRELEEWLRPLLPVRDGLSIVLRLLRDSGKVSRHVAYQGVFQQMLAGKQAQLLRIRLDESYACIPEISANKYALNIRFTTPTSDQRPKVAENDVEFELVFCNL